jgi:DNA-binding NarL/FixJ family response regulator
LWTAFTGEEAIEKADSFRPDVMVMDVRLPGINGIEATRQVRTRHPNMRIIVWTPSNDHDTRAKALAAGADVFLGKSGDPHRLVTAIGRLLGHESRRR